MSTSLALLLTFENVDEAPLSEELRRAKWDARAGFKSGSVSRQKVTIDSKITATDMMAISRAASELSGCSNNNQTRLCSALDGSGRSCSRLNPSSSRYLSMTACPSS